MSAVAMSADAPCSPHADTHRATLNVGLVPYLNAWPVAWGLGGLRDWHTQAMVPSALAAALQASDIDLALGSSIDAARLEPRPLALPVSPIASRGATRTVQLASSVPVADIKRLHCDTDSHTSVALARILLREHWGIDPTFEPWNARDALASGASLPEASLLIGDKVVTGGFEHHWPVREDLGAAWTAHTGRPFVYALWMLRPEHADRAASIAAVLDRQARFNAMRKEAVMAHGAAAHGWPLDVTQAYLQQNLCYHFDEAARDGLDCFIAKCVEHGALPEGACITWADVTRG